jgi:hypothetical protein
MPVEMAQMQLETMYCTTKERGGGDICPSRTSLARLAAACWLLFHCGSDAAAAGRKSSASGTLSVKDALCIMSIRTMIAAKEKCHPLIQKVLHTPLFPIDLCGQPGCKTQE